jgi:putative ABC transport system permease protein
VSTGPPTCSRPARPRRASSPRCCSASARWRCALGATRGHISIQFLAESALLAAIGGAFGLAIGAGATEFYSAAKHEPFIVPLYALIAAPTAGFIIGALAGLYPAAKAARLSPTEALRA